MYQTKRFGSVSEYEAWVPTLTSDVSDVSAFPHGFHVIATYFDPSVQPIPVPIPIPAPAPTPTPEPTPEPSSDSGDGKPSAADLDKDAEEKEAALATV